jgi:hypothetical protein
MASLNQQMNMNSARTARPVSRLVAEFSGSRSNNLTGTSKKQVDSKDGYESDDSNFSNDFNEIGGRGSNTVSKVSKRLGADSFPHKGVKAKVLFGDIYSDENDVEITWERSPQNVILRWNTTCNLEGEEGIVCDDNGKGFAGWDETHDCYLHYNTLITDSEDCMKILEINGSSPTSTSTTVENPVVESNDESDIGEETCATCPYVVTKGKNKGNNCGKSCDDNSEFCKKHSKKVSKSSNTSSDEKKQSLVTGGKAPRPGVSKRRSRKDPKSHVKEVEVDEKVEVEPDEEVEVEVEVEPDEEVEVEVKPDEEVEVDTCSHKFARDTKTASKGELCGKPVTKDGKCSTHSKTKAKKEIEKSGEVGSATIEMDVNVKDIMNTLSNSIRDILSNVLKSINVDKAMAELESDESQAILAKVIRDNIPKNVKNKTTRSIKAKKDPEAPKRPLSSYMFFCKVDRPNVKASNPDMKSVDITREMGKNWKALSDKKKDIFIKQAEDDKIRYTNELNNYEPSDEWKAIAVKHDLDNPKKGKGKVVKGRKAGPKRGLSGYMFFCKDRRAQVKADNDDFDAKEVTRELGRIWREVLTEEEKGPFLLLAEEDKARFEDEKSKWVDPDIDYESGEKVAPRVKKSNGKSAESVVEEEKKESPKTKKNKSKSNSDESEVEEEKKESPKAKKNKSKSKSNSDESEVEEEKKESPKAKKNKGTDGFPAFCIKHRPQVKETNPAWAVSKVMAELNKMWAVMDEDEKAEYISL